MCSTEDSLAGQVDLLAAVPVQSLPLEALMQLVADVVGPMNRLAGVVSRAVGEIAVRGGGQVPDDVDGRPCPTPAWLRSVAQVDGPTAGRQIRTAVALRELPAVTEAIIDGQLTVEQGHLLARLVGRIEAAALLAAQPSLIEVARRTDPAQLAQYVRHLLATWCAPQLDADEQAAQDARFLAVRNQHNGSWRGSFSLPDAAMEAVLTVLAALARPDRPHEGPQGGPQEGPQDRRSAGQRRADALTDVFALALRHGDLPDSGGAPPRLTYVLPAAWAAALPALAGPAPGSSPDPAGFSIDLDLHPGADCPTGPWTGPATRTQIRTLLCDAQLQALLLGSTGQILSLRSATGQITSRQRQAIAGRDRCCTTKGCSRPPAYCDVHHLQARADGGPTEIGNLVLLCRRHHVLWHRHQLDLTDLRVPWLRLPPPRAPDPTDE